MSFSSDKPLQANQLPISIEFPEPTEKNFTEVLSLTYKRIADNVSKKEGSLYYLQEQANFKQYFGQVPGTTTNSPQNFRNGYRSVYDLVALNSGNIGPGLITQPHGITGLAFGTLIYAGCTSTTPQYFSVMYPYLWLDAVNINFNNTTGQILTGCIVVAEYLKN